MKRILYIFITIFIISCISKPHKNIDNQLTGVVSNNILVEGIDYVILPYSGNNREIEYLFNNCTETDLTATDLENINIILNKAIDNYNKNAKGNFESDIILSSYLRQYIAVINKNKEKEIYVNCFPKKHFSEGDYWKTNFIMAMDGGNSFFQLKINLTKKTYYEFNTNGYA